MPVSSQPDVQQQSSTSANAALISNTNDVQQQLSTSANGVLVSIKSDIPQQPSTSANVVPVSSQPDVQQQPSAEETDVACHPPTKKAKRQPTKSTTLQWLQRPTHFINLVKP